MNQTQRKLPGWVKMFSCFGKEGGGEPGPYTLQPLSFCPDAPPTPVPWPTSFRSLRLEPEATCAETIQVHLPDETS